MSFAVHDKLHSSVLALHNLHCSVCTVAHPLKDLIESEGGISLLQHTILIDEGLQVLPGKIALN